MKKVMTKSYLGSVSLKVLTEGPTVMIEAEDFHKSNLNRFRIDADSAIELGSQLVAKGKSC
jgi:hypothetical protein